MKMHYSALVVAILGACGVLFMSLPALTGTRVVHINFELLLKDPKGKPIPRTEVVVWEYDYPSQKAETDDTGRVTFPDQSFQFVDLYSRVSQLFRSRPGSFPVRLKFPQLPEMKDVYYRFEITKDGKARYHAFNTTYDYFFGGQWLGEFDESGRLRASISEGGDRYSAVVPAGSCRCVPLWKSQAKLEKAERIPSFPHDRFNLHLEIQAMGKKWIAHP